MPAAWELGREASRGLICRLCRLKWADHLRRHVESISCVLWDC